MNERPVSHVYDMPADSLTGKVFPWNVDRPVFAAIPDNDSTFVPVFDTPELLHANMKDRGIKQYTIKQIDDGRDFLASLEEGGVRVMLNPWYGDGKTHWTEVVSPDAAFERFSGHYFSAESLRQVIRSTPAIPPQAAEIAIKALESAGAIKGEYADVMETGMILGTLHDQSQDQTIKRCITRIANWVNDLDRLPIIKRPGDTKPGSN